jgi:hypothetical protein
MSQKSIKTIERIAREILRIETLETRKSDSLDFHEVAVWSVKEALETAYRAGIAAGMARQQKDQKSGE